VSASYVDVHTHLTHERFRDDLPAVLERASAAGLSAIVVNGLEPLSNKMILDLALQYPTIKPALGIYPIDAVHPLLPAGFPLDVRPFDIKSEVALIRRCAQNGLIAAVGECGLDGHWLDASTVSAQEQVFEELLDIAKTHDIPAIIHSRKLEKRTFDILRSLGVKKANLHCYGGRTQWALEAAEKHGYWFSIPANATVSESFQKMLKILPAEKILTETDAPYLSPQRGQRNEPATVVGTVALMASLRGLSPEEARAQIYSNYCDLFGPRWT
jgi:TatD DNase family protein